LGTGAAGATILGSQTINSKGELVYTDEDDNDIQLTKAGVLYPSQSTVLADWAVLMNLIYPIGYVITLGVSTNPGTLLGVGTWTAITGTVIVGKAAAGTFNTLNATGGAETVTLTGAQSGIAAHSHLSFYDANTNATMSASNYPARTYTVSGDAYTDVRGQTNEANVGKTSNATSTTAAEAHSNLQPYIVKYCWERTA
jgi:hypothetical protein